MSCAHVVIAWSFYQSETPGDGRCGTEDPTVDSFHSIWTVWIGIGVRVRPGL